MITKALGGGGAGFYPYNIQSSASFSEVQETDLSKVNVAPTAAKIWTYSVWIKRGRLPGAENSQYLLFCVYDVSGTLNYEALRLDSGGIINFFLWDSPDGYTGRRLSTGIYRDPASWYHIVAAFNNTLATAADRMHLYVNGIEATYSDIINPDQNDSTQMNSGGRTLGVTSDWNSGIYHYGGLQSEMNFIDGQQLTPDDLGLMKNGVWVPKRYTGAYGDNGFHLNFEDPDNLGTDVSGNGNDMTEVNFTPANHRVDTPTNNFCVMNSVHNGDTYTSPDFYGNGNLDVEQVVLSTNAWAFGTIPLPETGKWYFEVELDLIGTNSYLGLSDAYNAASAVLYNATGGDKYVNGVGWDAYGDAFTSGDIIGVAVDMDSPSIEFYKNNVSQGSFGFVAKPTLMAVCYMAHPTNAVRWNWDFGQLGFTYEPPSGYKRLCSQDLPPLTVEANQGFDAVGYTGDGGTQSITDFNFQPDLIWIKKIGGAGSHNLADSVRGDNGSWMWTVYSDDAQEEEAPTFGIQSLDSNGFTVGLGGPVNENGIEYISYGFKKGPEYGFDIQIYDGTGTPHPELHDLGIIPEMIMVKNLSQPNDWYVYHSFCNGRVDPEDYRLHLNTINDETDLIGAWNDTAPTTSIFTVGNSDNVNKNGDEFVAYLFASIEGFSKIFGYEGNGDVDGPFIYCGFRPRLVMLKQASGDSVGSWFMLDSVRNTYNVMNELIRADFPDAETDYDLLDFASNGFKLRADTTDSNNSGTTYLGIAFAEHPLKYANAR